MLDKNNNRSHKKQAQNLGGFVSKNVQGGEQGRQVIKAFVTREQTSDPVRQLDDFQRDEGYQPFTPREVGIPIAGGKQAGASGLNDSLAQNQPINERQSMTSTISDRRHRQSQHPKRRRSLVKPMVLVLLVISIILGGFLINKYFTQLKHVFRGLR